MFVFCQLCYLPKGIFLSFFPYSSLVLECNMLTLLITINFNCFIFIDCLNQFLQFFLGESLLSLTFTQFPTYFTTVVCVYIWMYIHVHIYIYNIQYVLQCFFRYYIIQAHLSMNVCLAAQESDFCKLYHLLLSYQIKSKVEIAATVPNFNSKQVSYTCEMRISLNLQKFSFQK